MCLKAFSLVNMRESPNIYLVTVIKACKNRALVEPVSPMFPLSANSN